MSDERANNTSSEVFLGALPALVRAASCNEKTKDYLFVALQHWVSPGGPCDEVLVNHATRILLAVALGGAVNNEETDCLNTIIKRGALSFSPAKYLEGAF